MGQPFPFGARRYRPPILIPGWDFPVGRVSTNPLNVAVLGSNIPAHCSWSAGTPTQLSIGASGAPDFTISDWDFRGLDVFFYCQASQGITFDNCLFDLTRFSTNNTAFLGRRSGTPQIKITNCTFLGFSSPAWITTVFGQGISLIDKCLVLDWPADICDLSPVTGVDTVISNNWFRGACSAASITGLHADWFQRTSWDNSGQKLQIFGNRIEMAPPQLGGVGLTGIFNLGTQNGVWNSNVEIYDNYMDAGGAHYPIAITENPGGVFSGSVDMHNNYITGIKTNALYPTIKVPSGMTLSGLYDALTGAPVSFDYTNSSDIVVNGATSIP